MMPASRGVAQSVAHLAGGQVVAGSILPSRPIQYPITRCEPQKPRLLKRRKGVDRFWQALTQLTREKRICEFEQRDSICNLKTYFKVADAGSSTNEDAAFDYEKAPKRTLNPRTYAAAARLVRAGCRHC